MSALKVNVLAGAAAGNVTLTGIKTTDKLVSVLEAVVAADTGTSATGNKVTSIVDLTGEFSITATNTINNTSGTNTSGSTLIAIWVARS